jgi:ABC-type multidrug transport system fused ATPase/permease subunit
MILAEPIKRGTDAIRASNASFHWRGRGDHCTKPPPAGDSKAEIKKSTAGSGFALRDIDLAIAKGEVVAVVGQVGSGCVPGIQTPSPQQVLSGLVYASRLDC